MKKWMYLIFPGLGLGIFLLFYLSFSKEQAAAELAHKAEVAAIQAADDAKKKAAEEQARQDAITRQQQQQAEEEKRAADKQKKYDAETQTIQADIDKYSAEADKFTKETSDLEIQLDTLNKQKEQLNREDFDLLKQVEISQVNQKNAELEIQRTVDMIAQKADQSALTALPPPPPSS
jgi:hypothetical protein